MVLITGIAGYIGSHTAYALSQAGFDFVGWSLVENGTTITDFEWQDYLVQPNGAHDISGEKTLTLYAVFKSRNA